MGENFRLVPELWGRAAADGTIPRLAALMDGEPKGMLGICDGVDSSRYYIAAASSAPAGDGLEEYTVEVLRQRRPRQQGKHPLKMIGGTAGNPRRLLQIGVL